MRKKIIVQLLFSPYTVANWGGAEKVFINMSNLAIEKGYSVIDVYNDTPNAKFLFPLNKKVDIYNLAIIKAIVPFYKRLIYFLARKLHIKIRNLADTHQIKRLVEATNKILFGRDIYAIICYNYRCALVASMLDCPAPKIVMEHGPGDTNSVLGIKHSQEIVILNQMNAYQVLMPSFLAQAKKFLKIKTVCIPNIVPQIKHPKRVTEKPPKIIINVSRFNQAQKRQHLLVEAFAKIAIDFPDWKVYLYGNICGLRDKIYLNKIKKFIKKNKLGKQIIIKGATSKPLDVLQKAAICGFPSAYEGFSLSLTEAMSAGLPVIGFSDAPSVNDLIVNGQSGFLVKDMNDYANKLALLMRDKKLRQAMGKTACKQMCEYSVDKVWGKWEKLLRGVQLVQRN